MAFASFSITVNSTTPVQLNAISEADVPSPGAATFEELYGSAWEFDVGAGADIYVGPANTVTATGVSYHIGPNDTGPAGTRGRKYAAGTHVEMRLTKGDVLWAVTASGTSVCEGSVVGV